MRPSPALPPALFAAYTAEVLRYHLPSPSGAPAIPSEPHPERAKENLLRALRIWKHARKPHLVLLGLGSGRFACDLASRLPAGVDLTACSLQPEAVRALDQTGCLAELVASPRATVLADSSPWALFCLWVLAGLRPADTLVLPNPESLDPDAYRPLLSAFAGARPLPAAPAGTSPALTLAAILAPGDPGLPAFFAQIPADLAGATVLWDAAEPPAAPPACAVPARHMARPLRKDFAAQRNALLATLGPGWTLVLDADERLAPQTWALLPALAAAAETAGAAALALPRLTLYPDQDHVLAGFGLWPDLQVRLFRNTPGLHYERPVHERLAGLPGPTVLSLGTPILHLNRLLKTPQETLDKLAAFDAASGHTLRHTLSADYPRLPASSFPLALTREQALHLCLTPGGGGV
ncbi:MAG: hypothetical protein AB1916_15185 [Thermodesulfobacteriota bacterium]